MFGRGLGNASALPAAPGEPAASASAAPEAPPEAAPEHQLTALETFAEQGDVAALQQGVSDPDPTVQRKAFELLLARDGPGTIAFLTHLAQSEDPATRMPALFLLYDTAVADPAVPLERPLGDHRSSCRSPLSSGAAPSVQAGPLAWETGARAVYHP